MYHMMNANNHLNHSLPKGGVGRVPSRLLVTYLLKVMRRVTPYTTSPKTVAWRVTSELRPCKRESANCIAKNKATQIPPTQFAIRRTTRDDLAKYAPPKHTMLKNRRVTSTALRLTRTPTKATRPKYAAKAAASEYSIPIPPFLKFATKWGLK